LGYLILLIFLFVPSLSSAETACSKVKLEIVQGLTLERVAFDAKLVITNNMPDKDLTGLDVDILINDSDGNDQGALFYIAQPTYRNITDVSGNGTVRAGQQAEVHWLIIPSPGAGGTYSEGTPYWVGANLTYSIEGSQEVVSVNPDRIIVKPEAQLVLDYFTPYKVIGDNPFTKTVEPSIPFPLAVRVLNDGYGAAHSLKIESAQPKITENNQGLLVNFMLLGTAVNDSAVDPSLIIDIGDVGSKDIAKAYWEMISTLSGEFTEFDVSFTHAAELGGELTSLITETNAYYFIHLVKANLPGRDDRLDILADTDRDEEHLPDTLFESEIPGNTMLAEDSKSPVAVANITSMSGRPTAQNPNVEITIEERGEGWVYARTEDPSAGMLNLIRVIRADGVPVDSNNFWVEESYDDSSGETYTQLFLFHLLDYRADSSVPSKYTLVYEQPDEDFTPPTTRLEFSGPSTGTEPIYITPGTSILFTARDNEGGSGVQQMLKKVVGTDTAFSPAYPMNIETPGDAVLEYYSVDRAGNQEAVKTANLFVDDAAPDVETFEATPSSFSPHAPRGITAERTLDFNVKVNDAVGELSGSIKIARGETFSEADVVRTFDVAPGSGVLSTVTWNGRDKNDIFVPTGTYTARLTVTDGLEGAGASHTATADINVSVAEWFSKAPVAPDLLGEQLHPEISGTRVVWQDNRSGNWDIHLADLGDGGTSGALVTDGADQTRPSIDGNVVVWQDRRDGQWDIYGYDLDAGGEFEVDTGSGNQERPVVSGQWVAWQDDGAGNLDIYVYNMSTGEKLRVTSHERDQINPAIHDETLVWEDYRHGLGEIYTYDLGSGTEQRHTYNIYTQTLPAISNSVIAWTDRRTGQRDIYYSKGSITEARLTYGAGDHSQPAVRGELTVYTDYENGLDDPNLAFFDTKSGVGARLTSEPSRQEEPAIGDGKLVWQDDRDGVYQIYQADFDVESLPVEVILKPGFNLIAAGTGLTDVYPGASELISADFGIEKVVTYNSLNGIFIESSATSNIELHKGMGLGVYAQKETYIEVARSGETMDYTLLPGANYIGILSVPPGYRAYALLESLGQDNVQSVRKFNSGTGLWETAAVRGSSEAPEIVGVDFPIYSGEGLIVTMTDRVDGWRP
jgi:beta propeller repeat protein